MTDDELDPSNDPSNDPAQERVRRLLAEARHDAPVPDDVAARLDATLAGLVAERRRESVVDLDAARRRRRRWTTGLVAAAAAVVLGVSLPNLTDGVSMDGDSEAGSAADTSTSQDESLGRELAEDPGADSGGGSAAESAPSDSTAAALGPRRARPRPVQAGRAGRARRASSPTRPSSRPGRSCAATSPPTPSRSSWCATTIGRLPRLPVRRRRRRPSAGHPLPLPRRRTRPPGARRRPVAARPIDDRRTSPGREPDGFIEPQSSCSGAESGPDVESGGGGHRGVAGRVGGDEPDPVLPGLQPHLGRPAVQLLGVGAAARRTTACDPLASSRPPSCAAPRPPARPTRCWSPAASLWPRPAGSWA